MLVPISAVKFHANKYVNMKATFPVMNTTWAVVKIRPEKIQACPGFEIPFKLQGRPCWIPLRRNGCTILYRILYRSRDKNPRETRMYSNQLHVDSPNLCYRSTALEDKDIDFSSAKKLKKTLDQRIDSLHPNSGNSRKTQRKRRSNFARRVSIRRRNAGCVREAKYLEN